MIFVYYRLSDTIITWAKFSQRKTNYLNHFSMNKYAENKYLFKVLTVPKSIKPF